MNAQASGTLISVTPRWLTPEEQATWRAFVVTIHVVESELDRQLQRDSDMPTAYYAILVALSEAPDQGMRMRELAEQLCASQSRMTHAIASLERRGWVARQTCPTDRRGQFAVITPKGRAALETAAPGHVEAVRSMIFDQLSSEQVANLRDICETLMAAHDRTSAWPWAALQE